MWHYVLPLRGSICGKKIAIAKGSKVLRRFYSGKGRSKIVGRQLQSDLFKKNSLSNDSADTTQLEVAGAMITHATIFEGSSCHVTKEFSSSIAIPGS